MKLNKKLGDTNKIRKENERLQKQVALKTAALAKKEQELAIGSSLEKVRAVALSMKKPSDLLKICKSLYRELRKLGFDELRNALVHTFVDEEQYFNDYDYSDATGGAISRIPYTGHPAIETFIRGIRKSKNAFTELRIEGKQLEEWKKFRKKNREANDPRLNRISTLYYYNYSAGPAGIGISTYSAISTEKKELLKRFRNVFDLAYRRWADIRKAETQAWEAKVETSLERLRVAAMGMRKSEDLVTVCTALYKELKKLGFAELRNAQISIRNGSTGKYFVSEYSDKVRVAVQEAPINDSPLLKSIYAEMESSPDAFYQREVKGKEFREWRKWRMSMEAEKDPRIAETDSVWFYLYSIGTGYIGVSTFGQVPVAQVQLLKRFRNVFDLSYRRYSDIKTAEAQAKEAKIEASLERIRARTMAMHSSSELDELLTVLFEQFDILGMNPMSTHMTVVDIKNNTFTFRETGKGGKRSFGEQRVAIDSMDIWQDAADRWAKSEPLAINSLHFPVESLPMLWLVFHQSFAAMPEDAKITPADYPNGIYHTAGRLSFGYIGMNQTRKATEEEEQIVVKFANEFGRAYQRFLDLQKAEAQSRETEIELALERVRARTMAMQKPSELVDVINVIGEQFVHLGFDIEWVNFGANGFDVTGGIDTWNFAVIPGSAPISSRLFIPWFDHPLFTKANEELTRYKTTGNDFFELTLTKEEKDRWLDHMFTHTIFKEVPVEYRAFQYAKPGYTTSNIMLKETFLSIGKFDSVSFTNEQHAILRRFASAFGQTFTRFLDLQKVEAQVREAMIEAGLERVRSRAMGMQRSEELGSLIGTVFTEITKLDIALTRCLIMIFDAESRNSKWWMANSEDPENPAGYLIQCHDDEPYQKYLLGWDRRAIRWTYELKGEVKKKWDKFLFRETELAKLPPTVIEGMKKPGEVYLNASFNNFGNLTLATLGPMPREHFDILLRFAKVFDLTYTRFNDLKQAEAQAREAQIEVALERVRSKAMAMHRSEDLRDAVAVVFEELNKLDLGVLRVGISVLNKEKRCGHVWLTSIDEGKSVQVYGDESFDIHPLLRGSMDAWINQQDFYYILEGDDLTSYYKAVQEAKFKLPESQMFSSGGENRKQSCFVAVYNSGGLFAFRDGEFPSEAKAVMKRFAAVFDLTYKRFLDLQKAEAQSREAHIQLALERVRARTMAMQKSDELTEAAVVLFQQFAALGETPDRISIGIINEEEGYADVWATDQAGTAVNIRFKARGDEPTTVSKIWKAWREGKRSTIVDLEGKELNDWINYVRSELGIEIDDSYFHGQRLHQVSFFSQGWLNIITLDPLPPETLDLLDRFAAVFNLTYTRFIDLKKAEAQAKEAHIQLALERVRARTMAMQQSDELPDAANILFQQMESLEMPAWSAGYCIWDDDRQGITFWMSSAGIIQKPFRAPVTTDPAFRSFYDAYRRGKSFYVQEMGGNELKEHYKYMLQLPVVGEMLSKFVADGGSLPTFQIFHLAFFSQGFLLFITYEPVPESHDIFKRFGGVFDQTYTRFLDLQKAEAQAREAQIEAALERVRAKVIAMSNSNELQEISYVFGDQMRQLKIDWQFSYFWLIEEDKDTNTFWITWPDNHTSVTAYSLAATDDYTKECLIVWKEGKKMHSNYLPPENVGHFLNTFKQLAHDAGSSAESVMQPSNFKDGIYLYDGMMKYGSFGLCMNRPATEEENRIQTRFATEFERAYTRFLELKQAERLAMQAELDLVNLKIEKKKSEDALAELQVTQKQLVQSEKMASLGELTAGIAHEIQNPLNFVNNFSEVSTELLQEMVEAVKKGDYAEAQVLANDVQQNLEKINHHGKRADGIVKGMLQHSRTSSGQKELTDINALADEYLRLAYHGLRAKDKSFNAKFDARLDPSLQKLSIVPQDIGRVILNLINNAFYAVNDKKKQSLPGYEPTVTVTTAQGQGIISIQVKDNGSGIPQAALDKIFQPFFTTKPTGQGTGLGLSLSYDIVKAHGGELNVATKEGDGTTFTIQLPAIEP